MKNIAIPLLLAGSAKADPSRRDMQQDYAKAVPVLIADKYWTDVDSCDAPAVVTATTAVATAEKKLETEKGVRDTKATAVGTARTNVATATKAVIDADVALVTGLKADDDAQASFLTAQREYDEALLEVTRATTAVSTTGSAETAAGTALTDAQTILSALNDAKTAAATHLGLEETALTTAIGTVTSTLATLNTAKYVSTTAPISTAASNLKVTQATTDYNTAKTASDNKAIEVRNAKAAWDDATATYGTISGKVDTSTTVLNASNAGVAKNDADARVALGTKVDAMKKSAWACLAQDTVVASKALSDLASSYKTALTDNGSEPGTTNFAKHYTKLGDNECTSTQKSTATNSDAIWKCANLCTAVEAYKTAAGNVDLSTDQPTAVAVAFEANTGVAFGSIVGCVGFEYETTGPACKLLGNWATGSTGGTNTTCYTRTASTAAKTVYEKGLLSATSVISYTDTTATTHANACTDASQVASKGIQGLKAEYETQWDIVFPLTELLAVATSYGTKITASKGTWNTNKTDRENEYNPLNVALNTGVAPALALITVTSNNKTTLDGIESAISTANTNWQNAVTAQTAATGERDRQSAIKVLADEEWTAQNTIVGVTTVGSETGLAGVKAAAVLAKSNADTRKSNADTALSAKLGLYNTAWEAACGTGVSCVGADNLACLCGTAGAIASDLSALAGLRTTNGTKGTELATALTELLAAEGEVDTAMTALKTAQANELAEIVKCKAAKYDAYTKTLDAALVQRVLDLAAIQKILDKAIADKPARGKAGSRCEKAMSNGTFRPARSETTCDEGLCCGAARIPDGNITMTVETCQKEDAADFAYVPPRAPMATTMPTPVNYAFTCIQGAQKLAAAASALATAVYMLA